MVQIPNMTTEDNLVDVLIKRNALDSENQSLREELKADQVTMDVLKRGLVAALSGMLDSSVTFEFEHPSLASPTIRIYLDPTDPNELLFDAEFCEIDE